MKTALRSQKCQGYSKKMIAHASKNIGKGKYLLVACGRNTNLYCHHGNQCGSYSRVKVDVL